MEFHAEAIEIKDYREEEKLEMRVLKLRLPADVPFQYKAGQYVMLSIEGFTLRANPKLLKWTSYSLASSPHQNGMLEFCLKIKETEGFTHYLKDHLQLGMKLGVRGPFGSFTLEQPKPHIIFVATGSGIAPIIGILRHLFNNDNNSEITLIYGFRNQNYYVYREELEQNAKTHHNFKLIPALSRPEHKWEGRKGYVQEVVKDQKLEKPHETQAFICGVPIMVDEVKKILLEKGVPAAQIHTEQWEGA